MLKNFFSVLRQTLKIYPCSQIEQQHDEKQDEGCKHQCRLIKGQ